MDIPESCKPEMDNISKMTKRRLKKCTRIQSIYYVESYKRVIYFCSEVLGIYL